MIEIIIAVGQFITDNSVMVGYFFSIGCVVGAYHLSKEPEDKS